MDIETYAERHPQLPSEEIEPHLLDWLGRARYHTLLDVGCGNGRLFAAMREAGLLDDVRALGVDLSQTNVERLHSRLPEVQAAVDDAETLATVPDGEIDLLVSTQVMEHVDDARMLAAIRRVLAPEGTAYVSTVFKRTWARFIWRNASGEWCLDPTHVREYTSDEQLLRLLPAAGLALVESRKVQVSFPALDFFVRRLRVDPEQLLRRPGWRTARRLRIPVPGYLTWSLVLRPVAD